MKSRKSWTRSGERSRQKQHSTWSSFIIRKTNLVRRYLLFKFSTSWTNQYILRDLFDCNERRECVALNLNSPSIGYLSSKKISHGFFLLSLLVFFFSLSAIMFLLHSALSRFSLSLTHSLPISSFNTKITAQEERQQKHSHRKRSLDAFISNKEPTRWSSSNEKIKRKTRRSSFFSCQLFFARRENSCTVRNLSSNEHLERLEYWTSSSGSDVIFWILLSLACTKENRQGKFEGEKERRKLSINLVARDQWNGHNSDELQRSEENFVADRLSVYLSSPFSSLSLQITTKIIRRITSNKMNLH